MTHTSDAPEGSASIPFGFPGSMAGRFVIHERLGAGGMGEVYRAEDTQLKRTVAIKRLVQNDESASTRLLKEAQRASALNHRRIAGVYDVFTTGNELLLVMEYIDGITLRERMKRPISVSDFCTIALQCTEALSVAHENGILHGDLKPANIMLTRSGEVKVCDFGLARRLPRSDGAAETTTTVQQGIVGTPGYLAPETLLERPLDERADIFSLGVVFYQMLAARNPFLADGVVATLDKILHFSPEPLDRVNPHVPGKLARTISRMLEKEPRDRYASAAAVGEVLSSIARAQHRRHKVRLVQTWGAIAGVVALAALSIPRVLPQKINLAVLPFTVTGTTDREYFTQGLTEALNEQLTRLTVRPGFQVSTAADRREGKVTNAKQARDQLGANLALAGSLEYVGPDVRVSTALIDTKSGRSLRNETLTAAVSDSLAVQTQVVEAVVRMLGLELDPKERAQLAVGTTTEPNAFDFYLRGRGYLQDYDRKESVDYAIDLFRKSLAKDPRYALAYAGLGESFWRKHELTGSSDFVELARGNCDLALDNGPKLAEAHACKGMVLNGTGESRLAADEYNKALKYNPTSDLAYVGLAKAYEALGRQTDAEGAYLRAIKERPHYWGGHNNLGGYYYRAGRYREALLQFRQVVSLAPDSFRGHSSVGVLEFVLEEKEAAVKDLLQSMEIQPNYAAASNLGTLYYFEGQYPKAAQYLQQALKLGMGSYQVWGNLAVTLEILRKPKEAAPAFREARRLALERLDVNPKDAAIHVAVADSSAALGEIDKAKQALAQALKLSPNDGYTLFRIAVIYESRLKARDEALKWLTKAVEHGQAWPEIDRAPELSALREDPQFKKLRGSL